MPPLSTRAFARSVRAVPDPAFVAFVADLWTRRGFRTHVDGRLVRAVHPQGWERTLFVHTRSSSRPSELPDEPFDVVVTRWPSPALARRVDADVLGPEELRAMVLYGLDRENAAALLRDHLGRPLSAESDASTSTDRRSVLATAIGTGLVALGGLAGALAVADSPASDGPAAGGDRSPTASPSTARPAFGSVTDGPAPEATQTRTAGGKHPRPAERRPCATSAREAVERQLFALERTSPDENDGLETVWAFGSPEFRQYTGPFDEFVGMMRQHPFKRLLNAEATELGSRTTTGGVVRQSVVVTAGGERYTYTWLLSEATTGDRAGCWLTEGLTYVSDEE